MVRSLSERISTVVLFVGCLLICSVFELSPLPWGIILFFAAWLPLKIAWFWVHNSKA